MPGATGGAAGGPAPSRERLQRLLGQFLIRDVEHDPCRYWGCPDSSRRTSASSGSTPDGCRPIGCGTRCAALAGLQDLQLIAEGAFPIVFVEPSCHSSGRSIQSDWLKRGPLRSVGSRRSSVRPFELGHVTMAGSRSTRLRYLVSASRSCRSVRRCSVMSTMRPRSGTGPGGTSWRSRRDDGGV